VSEPGLNLRDGGLPDRREVKRETPARPAMLAELLRDNWRPFTLAPLQVYAEIEDDIIERFAGDAPHGAPADIRVCRFEMRHDVTTHCEGRARILEAMDKESYAWFKQWLIHQKFIDRIRKRYYEPRIAIAPWLDPFAWERGLLIAESLEVFTVSGMKARLLPVDRLTDKKQAKPYIILRADEPEPEVTACGKALLEAFDGR
jgi:hypothetical protein